MSDVLIVVLIAVSVVTVVGHLIWVTIAAIMRAILGGSPSHIPEERIFCRHCGAPNSRRAERCGECNRELLGLIAKELADLNAFERQLKRFQTQELLDSATVARLSDCVRERARQLTEPAAQPKAQAGPVQPAAAGSAAATAAPAKDVRRELPITAQVVETVKAPPPAVAPPTPPSQPVFVPQLSAVPVAASGVPPSKTPAVPVATTKPAAAPVTPTAPAVPVVAAPPAPVEPRLSWAQILESFMEERNIRWGELIGGLLMVGSAIGLVITLRKTLEAHLWLQFSVGMAVVCAFFGVGLYAYHRWKLQNTSRALLIVSTLMVPLYFFATDRLSKGQWTLSLQIMEAVSLVIFCALVWLAARILAPDGKWFQTVGAIGGSMAVLLAAGLAGQDQAAWRYFVPGLASLAVLAAAVGGLLYRLSGEEKLTESHANQLFTVLGTAGFSAAVALGLLVTLDLQVRELTDCLNRLSVLLALAATPLLSCGMRVVQGTSHDVALAAHRTAGTLTAILGGALILVALGMAWPLPLAVLVVSGLGCAVLTWVAFRYGFPVVHAGAIVCLTVAFLVLLHLAAGNVEWLQTGGTGVELLTLAIGATSGVSLVGLAFLLAAAACALARFGRQSHSVFYAGGCAVVTWVSLLIVSAHGWAYGGTDAAWAMGVFALDALALLAVNAIWRRPLVTYLGLALLLGATHWALDWRTAHIGQLWATVLAVESLAMVVLGAILPRRSGHNLSVIAPANSLVQAYRLPLLHVAEVIGVLALAVAGWKARMVDQSVTPVITAGCLVTVWLTLAWTYRSTVRSYLGSGVLLLGLVHSLVVNYPGLVDQPWVAALLGHATITVLASLAIWAWTQLRTSPLRDELRRVFVEPLANASMVTSTAVIPALAILPRPEMIWLAAYLFWLAAIWMIAACTNRSAGWLSAAQVVLTLAVAATTTAWLEQHPWVAGTAIDLTDPRSWQVHGIGLAVLTIVWSVVRIALRGSEGARRLLNPDWPAVDRLVAHAVVAGQWLLAAWYVWLGCAGELRFAATPASLADAFGPHAWWLLGLAALAMVMALWHEWRRAELVSGLLAAAAAPCLAAGALGTSLGTASALRWALAAWFVVGVTAIWCRAALTRAAARIAARIDIGPEGAALSRGLLLATSAVPVLLLTVLAALLRLGGLLPVAPAQGTFFAQIGPGVSYLVPLALVMAGLVGLALRERSAGYAFSAGLILQLGVVLGYALRVVLQKRSFQTADLVAEIQLAVVAASAWAVVWLIARRWGGVWRESGAGAVLMRLQLGMGALGNVLLLVPAIAILVLGAPRPLFPAVDWTVAAGMWLGWLALVLTVGAAAFRQFQVGRPAQPFAAGLLGMALIALLACTVCALWPNAPEWGYRTLMLGWAMYGLFVVLATWWVASIRTLPSDLGPPQSLVRAASAWVSAAGALAVLLGLKAAFLHSAGEDLLWSAAAIAIASIAGAAMAVWRRQEGWAFAAALGVNLAASLVVWFCQWRWHSQLPLADWWFLLIQANVIASAAVALVWLAARKRLYELRDLTVRASPLLAVQTGLGVLGNLLVLIPSVVLLVGSPTVPPDWMADLPTPAGWIALLLTSAAAAWYLRQVSPRDLFHVLGGLALGVGVLAAAAGPRWLAGLPWKLDPAWIVYHELTAAWAAMGLVVLGIGWLGRRWSLASSAVVAAGDSTAPRQLVCPAPVVQQWVTLIGLLAVALSLAWCYVDPERPWWSLGTIAAVSLTAGLLAVWMRLAPYVYVSGLLVNVAGSVAWLAWDEGNLATLVETNALCFALTSAFWAILDRLRPTGTPTSDDVSGRRMPFAHLAAQAAVALMAALTATLVAFDVTAEPHAPAGLLAWYALAAIAAASLISAWDRSARFVSQAIYLVGLMAVGILLDATPLNPREFCWRAAPALAAFVLAAATLGRLLPQFRVVWRALRIPSHRGPSVDQISAVQLLLAAVAAGLGLWIAVDFTFDRFTYAAAAWLPGRMVGPLATLFLLAASVLMAGRSGGRLRSAWRHAALVLGLLVLADIGWAWLSPNLPLADLHRSVILLVATMAMAWLGGMVLPRALAQQSEWIAAGRRVSGVLTVLGGTLVAAILGQEVYFHQPQGTPMALPAVAVMAVVLLGAIAALLTFAVSPERDPLHWSDRRRQAYVYLAELLVFLICVHLKLTVPKLFEFGIVEKYWMLLVMLAAFCGVGLSELFQRRGLSVLSEPLERTAALLPLAPAIGFWIPTKVPMTILLAGPKPAVWFLAAAFYGVRAATRRSGASTILSVIAVSVGFCVLWHQNQIGFLDRPQLWIIPIAMATLIAEYLNHDRLTAAQSGGLRYLASGMIYVSTTCDLFFLHRFADHLAVPLSLLVLSVLGVLAGIALRVRSFLAMGVTFLTVSILSMIYHAAFDLQQKWVLAVCGLVLGLAMLGLFAVFEKRRNDIVTAVKQLKQWQR